MFYRVSPIQLQRKGWRVTATDGVRWLWRSQEKSKTCCCPCPVYSLATYYSLLLWNESDQGMPTLILKDLSPLPSVFSMESFDSCSGGQPFSEEMYFPLF